MNSKKGQGISLNFIVLAIIAALVLVIIIAFTVGGLGTSLSKIFQAGETSTEDSDLDIAKASCESLCNSAKQVDKPEEWAGESYCTKTFTFDGEAVNCWDAPINKKCSDSGQDVYDTAWECDETTCSECSEISCNAKTKTFTDEQADEKAAFDLEAEKCSGYGYNDCVSDEHKEYCDWEQ